MAGGRPSKYKPEYCEIALEVLGAGGSRAALAARLDVTKSNLCEWEKVHPEFLNAIARGLAKSEALWESPDWHPDLHPARWKMNMTNRFGWSDKTTSEVTGKDGGPIQSETVCVSEETLKRMAKELLIGGGHDADSDASK